MKNLSFEIFFQRITAATEISTQQALARALGVNRSAVTQAKQRNLVPEKWILKIARMFALSPDWLESGTGHAAEEHMPVPKVKAKLCAGGGSLDVDAVPTEEHLFHSQWLRRKGSPQHMVLMDVIGDSMEPEIHAGDTVLVDQSYTRLHNGAIFAVGVDDAIMIKRVEKTLAGLTLHSDNPAYSAITLQGDELDTVRILGKIIWVSREY